MPIRLPFSTIVFGVFACAPWSARAEGCPALGEVIAEINMALDEALLDEAVEKAKKGQDALLCQSAPVNPMALSTVFHLKGAAHLFRGEERDAERAFEWAASVAPGSSLQPVFGEKATELYDTVRKRVLDTPPGRVVIQDNALVWIDGMQIAANVPTNLAAGPHLVQWQADATSEMKALELTLTPGEQRTLTLTGSPLPEADGGQKKRAGMGAGGNGANPKPILLGSGGALAGTGALLLGISAMRHAQFLESNDPLELIDLKDSINALTAAGLVTGVTGAGLLGWGLFIDQELGTTLSISGRF